MSERLSAYDHMQLWAGRRMLRENNRGQMLRSVLMLTGLTTLVLLDATNTDLDACAYTIEGSGSSVVEAIESFQPNLQGAKDLAQFECFPSIS